MNKRRRKKLRRDRILWSLALAGDNQAFACCSCRQRRRKKLIDDLSYKDIMKDFIEEFEKKEPDIHKCEELFWLLYLGDDGQQRRWRKAMIEIFRMNEGRNAARAGHMSHFLFLQKRKINLNTMYSRRTNAENTM